MEKLLLVCALLVSLPTHADVPLTDAGKKAFATLRTESTFSDAHVGFAGSTPPSVAAFRVLLDEPQRGAAFRALFETATLAGRLYALCGLYLTDPATFDREAPAFARRDDEVETLFGCSGGKMPVRDIVRSTSRDAVRLESRTQHVSDWARQTGRKSYRLDIVGGGYPDLFADRHH